MPSAAPEEVAAPEEAEPELEPEGEVALPDAAEPEPVEETETGPGPLAEVGAEEAEPEPVAEPEPLEGAKPLQIEDWSCSAAWTSAAVQFF